MNALFCTHLFEAGHKRTHSDHWSKFSRETCNKFLRKHTNNNFYFVIFRFFSEVNFVLLSHFSVSAANPMKNIIAYPFAKKPDDLHANFRPVAYEVYV